MKTILIGMVAIMFWIFAISNIIIMFTIKIDDGKIALVCIQIVLAFIYSQWLYFRLTNKT